MPWNGSGTYAPPAASFPEVNGTVIDAGRYNPTISDLASGITNAVAKDGQNVPTANLPMGGFKHTGADDGTAAGQYLVFDQEGSLANLTVTDTAIPDNGFYRPAANTLGFATAGAMRGAVDASGNFGLGTVAPTDFVQLLRTTNAGVLVRNENPSAGFSAYVGFAAESDVGETVISANSSGNGAGAAITGGTAGGGVYSTAGLTGGLAVGASAGPLTLFAGSTSVIRARFESTGFDLLLPTAAKALTINSHMTITLTSNTNLRFSVRGSDGVTRVANVTLA
jgi:hypothetical protein